MTYMHPDDYSISDTMTLPELMSATVADYHARGEVCPWDCGRCGFDAYDEPFGDTHWADGTPIPTEPEED